MKLCLLNLTFWGWVVGRVLCEAFLKLPPEKGEPCLSRHSVSWWNVMPLPHQKKKKKQFGERRGVFCPSKVLVSLCFAHWILLDLTDKIWSCGIFTVSLLRSALMLKSLWNSSRKAGQGGPDDLQLAWCGLAVSTLISFTWARPPPLTGNCHRVPVTPPHPPSLSPHLRENYRHPGTESPLYQWFSMDIAYAQWSGKVLYPNTFNFSLSQSRYSHDTMQTGCHWHSCVEVEFGCMFMLKSNGIQLVLSKRNRMKIAREH